MNRYLFYCDTPYHIFTTLNIVSGLYSHFEIDIVIYHQFHNSNLYRERLSQTNLFKSVYNSYPAKTKNKDIERLIRSKKYVQKEVGINDLYYDKVFFPFLDTNASLALYSAIKCNAYCMYEDGGYNYEEGFNINYVNFKRKFILKLFHPSVRFFNFSEFYLYSKNLIPDTIANSYKISFKNSNIMNIVFKYENNVKYKNQYIFLDQPKKGKEKEKESFDQHVNKVLSHISSNLVVRAHPRMIKSDIEGKDCDNCINLWEMECAHNVTDKHVLLSIFSTAMFQPSLLFNRHPRLIFLYKLCNELLQENEVHKIDKLIEKFGKSDSLTTINVPTNWEEFDDIINNLQV